MKRLTKRLEDGKAVMDCILCAEQGDVCSLLSCRNRLKDRLCDYEDVMQSNRLVEQKHGRWVAVPSSDMMTGKAYKCSECGKMRYGSYMPNYCQCCGSRMDGGADNGG